MRYFTSTLAIVAIACALAACSGKSSSSQQSNTATSTEATAAASGEATGAAEPSAAAATGTIPDYPGATLRSQTNPSSMMQTHAMGRVLTTPDSFDKVYAWYQGKMPAGSERVHLTQPSSSALFVTYDASKNQDSVNIAVSQGKTIITIGHVASVTK